MKFKWLALAAVVVAAKGHDYEFDEFLVRLFQQDYPAFRVIFAVESADDAAVPAIEKYRAIAPCGVHPGGARSSVDEPIASPKPCPALSHALGAARTGSMYRTRSLRRLRRA